MLGLRTLKRTAITTALTLGLAGLILLAGTPAFAQSCADLWYERNLIFAQNGFCFKSSLGQRMFSEFDCWTNNVRLTNGERAMVARIKAEEKRRNCKVN